MLQHRVVEIHTITDQCFPYLGCVWHFLSDERLSGGLPVVPGGIYGIFFSAEWALHNSPHLSAATAGGSGPNVPYYLTTDHSSMQSLRGNNYIIPPVQYTVFCYIKETSGLSRFQSTLIFLQ